MDESAAERIECRIEALLPLWASGDSPARAQEELRLANAGLASATGARCAVRYALMEGDQQCDTCADAFVGDGTDEMKFLLASLDATERLIVMEGNDPCEEIVSLLKEKLALYGRRLSDGA